MKKVLTVGVFDLLHRGHIELFRQAKSLGDHLTVWVHDDQFIKKKGVVESTEVRIKKCAAIYQWVDEVRPYGNLDEDIQRADFDIFASGEDQVSFPHFLFVRDWCREHKKAFVVLKRTPGISSSEIKEKKRLIEQISKK